MCLGKNNKDDDPFRFNEFSLKNSNEEFIPGIQIERKLILAAMLKLYVQNQVKSTSNYLDRKKKNPFV